MTLIGQTLAHYRIVDGIGAGGMGEVYRATDTKLGRDVALKVLPADMAADPQRLERFQREARTVATLNHPHIVTVYSVEEANGIHFLTMELVEGQTLDQRIPEKGLPLGDLLAVAVPLAEALTAAHEKGVVHRDLKPGNVMVTPEGRVKVLDFGLAKVADTSPDAHDATMTRALTREGVVMGTFPYMSPEQVAGRKVDARSDLFSLGIMLSELATGTRPFHGTSSAELVSAILRDQPALVHEVRNDLPPQLGRIVRRCLAKDPFDRFQTARDVFTELRDLQREMTAASTTSGERRRTSTTTALGTGEGEGFWIAVLPFKHRGTDPGVEALAEGTTEDIVTGLSRFSYLRVTAPSSTSRYVGEAFDVRAVGRELGARYVMEGSIRQVGSTLRVAVQLVDASSGAHLWAETYNRPFRPEQIFELQDDVVPRIVSTVADMNGVLPHTMSEQLRQRDPQQLSPYEALLRGFGYYERIDAEEHAVVRAALERAVQAAPDNADCWALLSMLYAEEHKHGFNARPEPLDRALEAARRAVAAAPSNNLAYHMLAQALFFRRELQAFRNAADRAIALNPMDGCTTAFMGILIAYAGDWDHGCALAEKAMQLNPHHPGWYRFSAVNNAYRKRDYRGALDIALKINMPSYYHTHATLAAIYGQLGERDAAGRALRELLALKPDFGSAARDQIGLWLSDREFVDAYLDGLRKAGLEIPPADGEASPGWEVSADATTRHTTSAGASPTPAVANAALVTMAVLPFSDLSPLKDHEYFCEGMAEEIMNALVGVEGIRVASRTSAFKARREEPNLAAIGRALSVDHVLEGSVRAAGDRLRVTAQLTDVGSGYQLWSQRYDRHTADVFAIQDEIANGVVDAVKSRLAPGTRTVRARPVAGNLEAYQCYLKGRHLRYTKNDHGSALEAFEEAVRLDPLHAPSWVGLAEARVLTAVYGLAPAREAYEAARDGLERAFASQGESAQALYVEGMVAFGQRDWRASERALRRAVELQPSLVEARCWFANLLSALGRGVEALPHLQHAREADPLAPYPYAMTGVSLLLVGHVAEAEGFLDQALAFETENTLALWAAGMTRVALGKPGEGVALLERATARAQRRGAIHGVLGWAMAKAGRIDEARAVHDELRTRPAPAPAVVTEAWLLGALGETDAAFHLLDRAETESQIMLGLAGLPGFDDLRSDPRFGAMLERLGLPAV